MRVVSVRGLIPSTWLNLPNHVYVGRRQFLRTKAGQTWPESPLHNPFKLSEMDATTALIKFEDRLRSWIEMGIPSILKALDDLTNESVLGCWCIETDKPRLAEEGAECHAEIIARVWMELKAK